MSMKREIILIAAFLFISIFTTLSHAHPGKTDANGGHKDNQNKSGLGVYHYHHGYKAHLHEDGFCPYAKKEAAPAGKTQNTGEVDNIAEKR